MNSQIVFGGRLMFLTLLGFTALKINAQTDQELIEKYKKEALLKFNKEEYRAALELYTTALKYDSLNPDIIKGRGDALFELRQCTEANEAFNLAIEQYKKLPDTNVNKTVKLERTYEARGYAKLCIKDCQNAVYDFDHVLKKIPNSQRSYLGKGNAFRCLEKYDSALLCYNPLISLNSKVSDFFSERGECFYHLGRYYEAICDLNRYEFLTKSSNEKMNPLAYFYRADCYFKLQKYDSAILDFEKTLLEYKSNSGVWVQLGDAYIFNDDFSNSRMCYERALDIDPQSIKAHKSMGRWELSQSHYPEAIEMLEFVKKSGYTEEIEYYNWLAIAKANWGDIEGSLSDLNYYLKSVPRDLNALILKLELLKFNPENYPEMLVVLDSCLILAETDWNKANFFLYKSVLSFHLGKYDSALLYINRSLELSPNTAEYHVNKAFYLYYIYEETDSNITISAGCKSELELALKLDDHCWQAYALFGVCYYYGGERELACRNMKLAYEYGGKIDPESIQFICHGLKLGQMEPTNLNVEIITFPKLN